MKIAIIVQARTNSSRLPGKILKKILGYSILELMVERLRRVSYKTEIVIATTINENDDPVVELAKKIGVVHFRGSENDVLSRVYGAAKYVNASVIVRCNSDCPLIDPDVINQTIYEYLANNELDYVSNILKPTFPTGLHTEVFSFSALEKANENANKSSEREHVTPYIYHRPKQFKIKNIELDRDLSGYRWTLDYPEDLKLIKLIYENLYEKNNKFLMKDILELIEANPEWNKINSHIKKKSTV